MKHAHKCNHKLIFIGCLGNLNRDISLLLLTAFIREISGDRDSFRIVRLDICAVLVTYLGETPVIDLEKTGGNITYFAIAQPLLLMV